MPGSGDFTIDPDSLRSASQLLQQCADLFGGSLKTLASGVTGGGSPWGSDEAGTMFGMAYTEITSLGLEALNHLGEGLTSLAEALAQMGDIVEATDTEQATGFRQSGGAASQ